MKEPLTRLTERTTALGNYNRKYIHIISTNIEKLTEALERQGARDRVRLWGYSLEIPGEMDTVLEAAADTGEELDFLGCYYALQFLHMNLRMVDTVKWELTSSPERSQTGKRLMLEAGRMFRNLTKCYMERLLNIFLDGRTPPEFVMMGVGTRADQDDIDLGIIHRRPEDAEVLNRAIGRLSNEMFRKATRLHFHLSEHVGENSLSATVEQYEEILDNGTYDFVIVTEMLGAALILGSYPLYEEFKNRVTNRFYHLVGDEPNRFHEGYLRGILTETHSLLTRLKPPASINPKDDGLRPIKALITALKLVHGVDKTNAWDIIDVLRERNPERIPQYRDLERTLSFFELFRHLYQVMAAQDEDIYLDEPGIENMVANIAEMFGFEQKGVVTAKDFMLVIYYEFLENSTQAMEILTDDLKKHLRDISIFKPIFSGEIHSRPGYKGNLAVDFIRAANFSRGITYWDDFLEELRGESDAFYNELVESFCELPERARRKVAQGYVAGIRHDPASVLRFLIILLERAKNEKAKGLFAYISTVFVEELHQLPGVSASLAQLLHAYPEFLNSFLANIDSEQLAQLGQLLSHSSSLPEPSPVHKQLLELVNVHHQSGYFFKRHFHKILNKYPVFIRNLHSNERLKGITNSVYSDLTSLPSLSDRMECLGDYYDLEFVRVSLLAMAGAGCERTDAEFIEFSDDYTLFLYECCQQDVHLSLGYKVHTRDRFALYTTGGHAREQGFDDDYDLIAILDSTESDEIDYCNKIIAKMNSHIVKRGILPHHRFADHFGSYVIAFNEFAEHLASDRENVFIDRSQVLSSRMLVGSNKLERKVHQEIIVPNVFSQNREYIDHMKAEMASRHAQDDPGQSSNIKECKGGLRDMEMLLLMYKARYKVRDPLSRKFLRRLAELEPKNADKFAYIRDHMSFIRNLRDLYRLRVTVDNVIDPKYLPAVAASMGYGSSPEAVETLFAEFQSRTERAFDIIQKLVSQIEL